MNKEELKKAEDVINTEWTEDNLRPLVPLFPEKEKEKEEEKKDKKDA